MSLSPEDARRAFTIWLRTGRRVIVEASGPVETKYNHWHDPRNGQFTYASAGRHDGSWGGGGFTGGGGGDFGGGGASATEPWGPELWPWQRRQKANPKVPAAKRAAMAVGVVQLRTPSKPASPKTSAPNTVQKASPGTTIREIRHASYEFKVDDLERTRGLSGFIAVGDPKARSRTAQRRAGEPDRRQSDDGGHFIAPRFKGPTAAFNHFAQDANFNRGAYRVMEDTWAKAKKNGERVSVRMTVSYPEQSRRPSEITVWYGIKGNYKFKSFHNEPQGKHRDR